MNNIFLRFIEEDDMKRIPYIIAVLAMALLTACSAPAAQQTDTATTTSAALGTPAPTTAQDAIAAASADELRAMIARYKDEGNWELLYAAALRLTELDPSDADAYMVASEALLEMARSNIDEINALLAQGVGSVDDAKSLSGWAEQHQIDFTVKIPFAPDYTSAEEINTDGITTGNQTNAGKYDGAWRGGLLTWQGDWVYLSRPDEGFAIYKVRADGSDYQRVGEGFGSSLNVIGDWMYFINAADGDTPYRMRTDGSMMEKLTDDGCAFYPSRVDICTTTTETTRAACTRRGSTAASK